MLQVTYMVRNSEWVLTNAARGNNDIEFCAEAKHRTSDWNGNGGRTRGRSPGSTAAAQWDPSTGTTRASSTTVANPSKVKTDGTGSPAVCGRGNQDLPTGLPDYGDLANVDDVHPVRLGLQLHGLETARTRTAEPPLAATLARAAARRSVQTPSLAKIASRSASSSAVGSPVRSRRRTSASRVSATS